MSMTSETNEKGKTKNGAQVSAFFRPIRSKNAEK
jgi:hypothetical protein